jgi:hypothetical protein
VTPELVLQRRYHHRNGARGIAEVILCDPTPDETAARYARIAGYPVTSEGASRVIDLGRAKLIVVGPAQLGVLSSAIEPAPLPYLAGFTVRVDNLDTPRTVLRAAQVPFREIGGRVIVTAKDALGCAVLFAA